MKIFSSLIKINNKQNIRMATLLKSLIFKAISKIKNITTVNIVLYYFSKQPSTHFRSQRIQSVNQITLKLFPTRIHERTRKAATTAHTPHE